MKINSVLFIVFSISFLASCGKTESTFKNPAQTVKEQVLFSLHPLAYPSTHANCSEPTFDEVLGLNVLSAGEVIKLDTLGLNFSYASLPVVKNSVFLTRTVKNKRFLDVTNIYVDELGNTVDASQDSTENSGDNLIYCREQELERASLEHVALDVISTLDKSIFILSTIGLFEPVAPITVYSHPAVESVFNVYADKDRSKPIQSESSTMTDNAFYYDNGLYFIPHSEDYKDYLKSVGVEHIDFWEIPFVASHEYGHHIFNTFFYKNENKKSFKQASRDVCFKGRDAMEFSFEEGAFDPREVTNEDVLSAFNEGFADMFALYSLDRASSSLVGVFGFENEREIESLFLLNGRAKAFTSDEAEAYFATFELGRNNPMSTYQDGHTIGAIYATAFNLLMTEAELQNPQRLKVSINWLQNIRKNFEMNSLLAPKNFMLSVVNDFLATLKKEMGVSELTPKQQEILKSTVPFYFQ